MANRGSSRILAARSRVETWAEGLKMDPGRRPVSFEGPLSGSSYWSVICLSMGRPRRYSSLDTWPAGPWYIQSRRSSLFLSQHENTCFTNYLFFFPIHQIDTVKEPTWWRLFPLRILSFLLCFAHFSVLSGALRSFFFRLHVFVQLSRLVQYSSSSGGASSFSDSVRSKVLLEVTGPMLNNLYVYRVGSWFFKTQKYLAKIRKIYGSVNHKIFIWRHTLCSKNDFSPWNTFLTAICVPLP